jgi:hypothetical protein
VFQRMRDRIDDPFAIWVEQVTITERDEQPVPANYNLRISPTLFLPATVPMNLCAAYRTPSSGPNDRRCGRGVP